jgi:hypothetical protein
VVVVDVVVGVAVVDVPAGAAVGAVDRSCGAGALRGAGPAQAAAPMTLSNPNMTECLRM